MDITLEIVGISGRVHVGDIGTSFIATVIDDDEVAVDISSATDMSLILKDPDDTVTEYEASFYADGKDGKLEYTTVEDDDISVDGSWQLQAALTLATPAGAWHSEIKKFRVYPNLE